MNFRNCDECGEYRYIKENGLCPTCNSIDVEIVNHIDNHSISLEEIDVEETNIGIDMEEPDITVDVYYVGMASAIKIVIKQYDRVYYCGSNNIEEKLQDVCEEISELKKRIKS